MRRLFIDIETYSSVDLKKSGVFRYVEAPDFEVLLFAYAFDDEPVRVIDLTRELIPPEVLDAITSPGVIKYAHNAAFELACFERLEAVVPANEISTTRNFNIVGSTSLAQWRCTMVHAMYCGLPAGLDQLGEAIGLDVDKKKLTTGKALIRTFCVPARPTKSNGGRNRTLPHHEPEKWELFKQYCAMDVEAERAVYKKLQAFPVPDAEIENWHADLLINKMGVAVDMALVAGALKLDAHERARLTDEAVALTGLDNPNSVAQLKDWLGGELETEIERLNKSDVLELLGKQIDNGRAKRVLELRQKMSKTSTKKYEAIKNTVCADGRVRGLLQFYGASRTGRWAGRLVQIQNLPRTYLPALDIARLLVINGSIKNLELVYGNVPDALSQLVRTAFVAQPSTQLIAADYSAIEGRVVAWLAGEQWALEVFKSDGKIYEATAANMFGVPITEITKDLRQKGKVATLALGYGGGTNALVAMGALNQGLTEEELPDIVYRWRNTNRRICDLWRMLENAALQTVDTGRPHSIDKLILALEYANGLTFLTVGLPSGRKLYYAQPRIIDGALHYMGVNQTSRKWCVSNSWGGKLVENVVQAIARDCLAESIKRMIRRNKRVVFHVHDEIVVESNTLRVQDVCAVMCEPMPWAPDLPLAAEGYSSAYYKKD